MEKSPWTLLASIHPLQTHHPPLSHLLHTSFPHSLVTLSITFDPSTHSYLHPVQPAPALSHYSPLLPRHTTHSPPTSQRSYQLQTPSIFTQPTLLPVHDVIYNPPTRHTPFRSSTSIHSCSRIFRHPHQFLLVPYPCS